VIKLIDILKEAKQVGTLYHSTSGDNLISILKSNSLKTGMPSPYTNEIPTAIFFTRNKNYRPGEYTIEVDGDKLSNNYKIRPYDSIGNRGEAEEYINKTIENLSKYLINIYANVEAVQFESYKEFEKISQLYPSLRYTIGGEVLVDNELQRSEAVREIPKQEAITYIKYNKY